MIEEGKCVHGKDINFQLTGFTLSGKVVGSALPESTASNCDAGIGPEGVTVQLRGKQSNVPARATITAPQGRYSFHNVMPGEYLVTATHTVWNFSKVVPLLPFSSLGSLFSFWFSNYVRPRSPYN